jgi:antitoxin CptB
VLDTATLNRLKWTARRGLLENDIVLERFFQRYSAEMTQDTVDGLHALLALGDNELLDLTMARTELDAAMFPADVLPHVTTVLAQLRSA